LVLLQRESECAFSIVGKGNVSRRVSLETKPAKRSRTAKSAAKTKKAGSKKAIKGGKEGSSQEIPAGANVRLLARALWTARAPENAKLPAEQKKDAWKRDQKEYRSLARKVVNILKRRMGKANPGANKKGAGEPDSMEE
jgi:hypothetical protein